MAALVAALTATPSAWSAPGISVGAVENGLMWNTGPTVAAAQHLGLRTMAVTLEWEPTLADLNPVQVELLTRAVMGGAGLRIVLGAHNSWPQTPVDAASRQRYCEFAANALRRFPQINDFIVWNEPNVGFFWRPQFDADGGSLSPRGYFELISHCYDVLHAVRPGVNIVGPVNSHWGNDNPNAFENVSHSPTHFIRELGAVYRASGRTRPLFDTLGHHPYPRRSDEHPSLKHTDEAVISIGDGDRLLAVMAQAFGGTAQPIPQDGLPIWYLETGYQTRINPDKAAAYDGDVENWAGSVFDVAPGAPVDQASQLTDSLRLVYCRPHVEAIFNFLLRDERQMAGWQSGVFWADGTPKASLEAYRSVIREVNEGRVNCTAVPGAPGVPPVTSRSSSSGGPAGSGAGSPSGGAGQPQAQRSISRFTYTGSRKAVFGQFRLRAQLTRGVKRSTDGLGARQVTFQVGKAIYLTTTNAEGVASVAPSPPTRPGKHRVRVRFRGDELTLGSGTRASIQVVNSRGRVTAVRRLLLAPKLTATLSARSDGRLARGTLVLRQAGRPARKVRLTALGLLERGRVVYVAGTDGRSNRYDIEIRRLAGGRLRLQILRNNEALHPAVTIPAGQLRIARS